ncbi:aspartate--ammonia ligase [Allofustis seminis]|uniref:aspartate--ammonia ligase n=1 Tax=Allofustis seminis TaxID=166939 RepID=UPI00036124AC|nr:aspartate--ammonia ligase [Allofustis seminis]
MSEIVIPKDYKPVLNQYDIQRAIDFIKISFQQELATTLGLQRVSAPLFVTAISGLNDNLSGVERPVSFDVPALNEDAQVVQSLAKWKRVALAEYHFRTYEGLFTDMNAIRRDEVLDNIHSIYVDQWDWEKIIQVKDRTETYLKDVVQSIVDSICNVNHLLKARFPQCNTTLRRKVTFTTAQALEDLYPHLTPEEREREFARIHKTIFVGKIGAPLMSGQRHGHRAPDYDDWQLNGDIIFWNDILEQEFEISSMGIRVTGERLLEQLEDAGRLERRHHPYHQKLLAGQLPLTIGGGIGQSRLCMLLIGTAHIGEVQASLWDESTRNICKKNNIPLL